MIPLEEKSSSQSEHPDDKNHLKAIQVSAADETRSSDHRIPTKKTYLQELKVYNGIFPTRVSFWSLLLRPFIACLTPVCLWASLLYGAAITWLVLIATSVAQIFSAPRKSFMGRCKLTLTLL
jgi:hypothetical protein